MRGAENKHVQIETANEREIQKIFERVTCPRNQSPWGPKACYRDRRYVLRVESLPVGVLKCYRGLIQWAAARTMQAEGGKIRS